MLTRILFESTWLFLACWVPTQLTLIAFWSWQRSIHAKRMTWAGFLALPVLLSVSHLVETQREQIEGSCRQLAKALERADVDEIERSLSEDLRARGLSKDELLTKLESRLEEFQVSDATLHSFDVTVADDGIAEASFRAMCRVQNQNLTRQWVPSRWRFMLRRSGNRWLVTRIESLPIPAMGAGNIRDWL